MSLSLSGYLGMTFASRSGDALAEYAGIWYLGAASSAVWALAGWVVHCRMQGELRGVPLAYPGQAVSLAWSCVN